MKRSPSLPPAYGFMILSAISRSRSLRRRRLPRLALGLTVAACSVVLLSACNPTKGSDPNAFTQAGTDNTDFTFPGTEIPVGLEPTSVAIAPRGTSCPATATNFLAPNAAVANFGDNTVTFLRNNGSGVLTPQTLNVGIGPAFVQFADLDLSNAAQCTYDMVVLLAQNAKGIGNGVTVLLTTDNVTWTTQTLTYSTTPAQVRVADMNGDGYADLVVSLPALNALALQLNDGVGNPGHFSTPAVMVALPGSPGRFVVADYLGAPLNFDGDPCTDLAVLSPGSNAVYVLTTGGTCIASSIPAYSTPAVYTTSTGPVDIGAGDVNGDGFPELIVLTASLSYLNIFQNSGTVPATFATFPGSPILLRASPSQLVLAKFAAGKLGVGMVHPNDKSAGVVQWNGSSFINSVYPVRENPVSVGAGIFTTSANVDMVFAESLKRIVFVAHGDGTGVNFGFTQIGLPHIPGAPALGRLRAGPGDVPGASASATVPVDMLVPERNNNAVLYLQNRN